MKDAFDRVNGQIREMIPSAIYDSMPIAWFRGWLWSYVTFDKYDPKKNEDPKSKEQNSFRN